MKVCNKCKLSKPLNNFYVYRHIRSDTNIPFYVGKGKDNRAYSTKNRNKYWHHIINSTKYEVEIILENLTEMQAFSKEKEFIKLYKTLGYCVANFTDGGEGISGFKPSLESIKKSALSRTGLKQNPETIAKRVQKLKGKFRSLETRKKISETLKLKGSIYSKEQLKEKNKLKMRELRKNNKRLTKEEKSLIHRQTSKNKAVIRSDGKEFISVRDAARQMDCQHSEISRAIKRNIKAQGFNWSYKL